MPPKTKAKAVMPAFKKRVGKSFLPAHEYINEQTKESYLVEIGELDKRLGRYEVKFDELDAKNKQYHQLFKQLEADQQETVSLYTKTLEQRVDEISDLNDRIIGLQQVKDSEKSLYETQLQQLRTEYKETKEQLIADNMVMGTQLAQLDEFRLRRAEFSSNLTTLQHKLEDQQQQHTEQLQQLQQKHEQTCQRMKEKMIERLHDVAHEFRKATNRTMAETTKRTISENVIIDSQLTKMADKTGQFHIDNAALQQRVNMQRHQMALQEITQNDLARDYISGTKLVEMLTSKVKQHDESVTQSSLKAEQTHQLQLESQVLTDKLSQTKENARCRQKRKKQLKTDLENIRELIKEEDDKLDKLKNTVQTVAELLTRVLQSADGADNVKCLLRNVTDLLANEPSVCSHQNISTHRYNGGPQTNSFVRSDRFSDSHNSPAGISKSRTGHRAHSKVITAWEDSDILQSCQQHRFVADEFINKLTAETEELTDYCTSQTVERNSLPPLV